MNRKRKITAKRWQILANYWMSQFFPRSRFATVDDLNQEVCATGAKPGDLFLFHDDDLVLTSIEDLNPFRFPRDVLKEELNSEAINILMFVSSDTNNFNFSIHWVYPEGVKALAVEPWICKLLRRFQ